MAMIQCKSFGHWYDDDQHTTCPQCGVPGLDMPSTVGKTEGISDVSRGRARNAVDTDRTVARGDRRPSDARPSDHPETVAFYKQKLGFDPVVGWLVCIDGPDKGRDFRIRTERNNIGREPAQRDGIIIPGDPSISREKHAVISYNPKNHRFNLIPGDGRGITYLNDDELLTPQPLNPYDRIEMGNTKLIFVPFCGEHFTWSEAEADDKSE
jgi:hypothetical protein